MGSICFFGCHERIFISTLEMPPKKRWRCFSLKKDVEDLILGVVVDDDVGDCDSVPQCTNVAKNHAEGMKC